MAKKKKNIVHYMPFENVHIIGIASTLVDYKLAFYINEKFKFNLIRIDEITIDSPYQYSQYYYYEGENKNTFNLLSLKNKDHCCTKELQNLDYVLIVREDIDSNRLEQLRVGIREINNVMLSTLLDINRIGSLSMILDTIEYFEIEKTKDSPK